MGRATPIGITTDSGDEAESTGQELGGITRKRRRNNATESPLPSPKHRQGVTMRFRIRSLKCEINKKIRSYALGRNVWSWTDSEDHAVLKGRVDLDAVVDVEVQPDIGYPVRFTLTRSKSHFEGRYAEDGTIKIGEKEMEATLALEDPSVRALVGTVFL
jgi:hypothetical protein